jgi:CRISPR-associated protein Cas2
LKEKQFIVLIIYDIVDNKNRARMVKCLEKYGVRVQKSAFEALLVRRQYDKLMREAQRIIDPSIDSLRIYILDDVVNVFTWGLGIRKEQDCVIL